MPHFFTKKPKTFSIDFSEINDDSANDTPFWESQRNEALNIITTFYSNWQALWQGTKNALGDLRLNENGLSRLNYYETEQRQTILKLLAKTLVAWEKDDSEAFSNAVISLAHELRPSLTHFENDETTKDFSVTPAQAALIKNYTTREALYLKQAIENLQKLSWYKFEFGDKVLTEKQAEELIKERLNIMSFDFLDFATEPEFNAHGFFPALLQDSADFGL